jgi:hypothetical protein
MGLFNLSTGQSPYFSMQANYRVNVENVLYETVSM